MSSNTLLSAVTTNTTSSEQAVSGYVTIIVSTSGDINNIGDVTVYLNDVVVGKLNLYKGYVMSLITGTVNLKAKAKGTAETPITVTVHDAPIGSTVSADLPLPITPGDLGASVIGWWDYNNISGMSFQSDNIEIVSLQGGHDSSDLLRDLSPNRGCDLSSINGLFAGLFTDGFHRTLPKISSNLTPPYSIFILGEFYETDSSDGYVVGSTTEYLKIVGGDSANIELSDQGGSHTFDFSAYRNKILGTPVLIHLEAKSPDGVVRFDGGGTFTTQTEDLGASSFRIRTLNLSIGSRSATETLNLARMKMGEIIFYSGQISESNRIDLEGYFANKWGLNAKLPVDHAHKVTPTEGTDGGASDPIVIVYWGESYMRGTTQSLITDLPAKYTGENSNVKVYNEGVLENWNTGTNNNQYPSAQRNNSFSIEISAIDIQEQTGREVVIFKYGVGGAYIHNNSGGVNSYSPEYFDQGNTDGLFDDLERDFADFIRLVEDTYGSYKNIGFVSFQGLNDAASTQNGDDWDDNFTSIINRLQNKVNRVFPLIVIQTTNAVTSPPTGLSNTRTSQQNIISAGTLGQVGVQELDVDSIAIGTDGVHYNDEETIEISDLLVPLLINNI